MWVDASVENLPEVERDGRAQADNAATCTGQAVSQVSFVAEETVAPERLQFGSARFWDSPTVRISRS